MRNEGKAFSFLKSGTHETGTVSMSREVAGIILTRTYRLGSGRLRNVGLDILCL